MQIVIGRQKNTFTVIGLGIVRLVTSRKALLRRLGDCPINVFNVCRDWVIQCIRIHHFNVRLE